MNNTIFRITALVSGVLFGMGMAVSGMIDPAKVVGFLDISGNWDPSLAFVMGGALAVFMPSYFYLSSRENNQLVVQKCVPRQTQRSMLDCCLELRFSA